MIWILIIVLVVLALWLASIYNGFIMLVNQAKSAWSDIDVQLKRRYDLIPNLVETVKGYATHESETFLKLTQARAAAMGAQTPGDKAKAEGELSTAMKSIFAVAENYPDLKASDNFMQLQQQLAEIEDNIQAARRFYNGAVRDLNTRIEIFPNNLMATMFNVKKMEFFGLDNPAEAQPVKVQF